LIPPHPAGSWSFQGLGREAEASRPGKSWPRGIRSTRSRSRICPQRRAGQAPLAAVPQTPRAGWGRDTGTAQAGAMKTDHPIHLLSRPTWNWP